MKTTHREIVAVCAAAVLVSSCGGADQAPADASAEMMVSAAVVSPEVSILRISVSAADMPTTLIFNLAIVNGYASATLRVPAGQARAFAATAFSLLGEVTHEGSVVLNVHQGLNPPATIPLVPRAGRVPITVQLAELAVQVTPATATVDTGSTAQLSATVRIVGGAVVAVPVDWATDNPAIAAVSTGGLVTCAAAGQVEIQAVAEGVPGQAFVTCVAPPAPRLARQEVRP